MSTLTHPLQHVSGKDNDRHLRRDHEGTVSIGDRTITNLRFADDINGLAGEEEELAGSASPRGQRRTGKNGGYWLRNHLWYPTD